MRLRCATQDSDHRDLPWKAVGNEGSSSPLRRSGMGDIAVCGRLRLCTTPCALRGGKTSTNHTRYKQE